MQEYFTEQGFRVLTTTDGQNAIYMARHEPPDLILLDIMMPKMDGYQFLRQYRLERQTPVIIITAREEETDAVLGGIAGISLAVGGIGTMNIMLTTVTERKHEIGLRKAIGAKRRDILLQFLVESMVLSLVGGLIGVFFGWGAARLMGQIQYSGLTITPVVGLDSILLATLFSMAIGLFFGIYPATRAARLQPVEALRYE
jgi:ABC-type antimicrobial peptide transport system permease subunit